MSKTLTGNYVANVFVAFAGNSPLTVLGTIAPTGGTALNLLGGAAYDWAVVNSGNIDSSVNGNAGIDFGTNPMGVASGTLTNLTGGYIYGAAQGVEIYGPGSVTNQTGATIKGGQTAVASTGALTVTNAGFVGADYVGVQDFSLTVTNQTGGTIYGDHYGIRISGSGTITN